MNPKYIQIDYKYLIIEYVPISVNRGKLSLAINNDMKLNFVPLFIMEFLVKKFCTDFFGSVMKASATFAGSEWEAKTKKNPSTFLFYKEIIDEYYRANQMR